MTDCSYFRDYPARTGDRKLFKMEHYLEHYDALLAGWQGRDVSFLEIGVYRGGSLPMWQGFLGPGSRLVFLDIDPACRDLALPGTTVEIGDQADPVFLEEVGVAHGPFDLIVDDGGHKMHQQITSFRHLWPRLRDRGLYIVEDGAYELLAGLRRRAAGAREFHRIRQGPDRSDAFLVHRG